MAVGLYRGLRLKQPTQFWIKWNENCEEYRKDAAILKEMWALVGSVRTFLLNHGFVLRFAQSTYHHRKDEKDSCCLDLTLERNGESYWLECKFCDPEHFNDAVAKAKAKVTNVWEVVAATAEEWRLDDHLGGGPCIPPQGFGYVVFTCESLCVSLNGETVGSFYQTAFINPPAAPKQSKKHRVYTTARRQQNKQCKQKKARKEQRQHVEGTSAVLALRRSSLQRAELKRPTRALASVHQPILKRPASRSAAA